MKWKLAASIGVIGCAVGALAPTLTQAQSDASVDARNRREQIYAINSQDELLKLTLGGRNGVTVAGKKGITGLRSKDRLTGIDFRPSDGMLYALGTPAGGAGLGQIYAINLRSAAATAVGPGQIPLTGTAFGFDFNPVPDLIRITSNAGENKRVNPTSGALVQEDGQLAYPETGDPNSTRTPGVAASAYTNPDTDPLTHTVLFELDVARQSDGDGGDVLAIQVPPNAGTLNTVGRIGVDVTSIAGLDIGASGIGLAAVQQQGATFSSLVEVDLVSGALSNLGKIGRGRGELVAGIAIQTR